jgi:hypothetical protein
MGIRTPDLLLAMNHSAALPPGHIVPDQVEGTAPKFSLALLTRLRTRLPRMLAAVSPMLTGWGDTTMNAECGGEARREQDWGRTPIPLTLACCPEPGCGAPAEVRPAGALYGTSGPVAHVRTDCAVRHWFVLPADQVQGAAPAVRPAAAGRSEARPPGRVQRGNGR